MELVVLDGIEHVLKESVVFHGGVEIDAYKGGVIEKFVALEFENP